MRDTPSIFISSTHSLRAHREEVCRVVIDEFGWGAKASGVAEARFGGETKASCVAEVETADLYLGIFGRRSGELVVPHSVTWTEMEFYHALNLRKPMLLYVLNAPGRDRYSSLFVRMLGKEPRGGVFFRACDGLDDLLRQARGDLEEFGRRRAAGETFWVPPPFLKDELRQLGVFADEYASLTSQAPPGARHLDGEQVREGLARMQQHYDRLEFPEAAAVGAELLGPLLRGAGGGRRREPLEMLSKFLLMWAGSCTWLGYVGGSFGAVWAAHARRESYRRLEAWNLFNQSAALITNCLYVLSSFESISAAHSGSAGSKKYHHGRRKALLKTALLYDDWYLARAGSAHPSYHRSSILRELGDYDAAAEELKRLLRHPLTRGNINSASGEVNEANYTSYLGLTTALGGAEKGMPGAVREGVRVLRQAEASIKRQYHSPYYVNVMRRVAEGLLLAGEKEEAESLLRELHAEAVGRKLLHQAALLRATAGG